MQHAAATSQQPCPFSRFDAQGSEIPAKYALTFTFFGILPRRRLASVFSLAARATAAMGSCGCDDRLIVALIFVIWFLTNLTINFYNKCAAYSL